MIDKKYKTWYITFVGVLSYFLAFLTVSINSPIFENNHQIQTSNHRRYFGHTIGLDTNWLYRNQHCSDLHYCDDDKLN